MNKKLILLKCPFFSIHLDAMRCPRCREHLRNYYGRRLCEKCGYVELRPLYNDIPF
jgi:ribosomal protein S27AE